MNNLQNDETETKWRRKINKLWQYMHTSSEIKSDLC